MNLIPIEIAKCNIKIYLNLISYFNFCFLFEFEIGFLFLFIVFFFFAFVFARYSFSLLFVHFPTFIPLMTVSTLLSNVKQTLAISLKLCSIFLFLNDNNFDGMFSENSMYDCLGNIHTMLCTYSYDYHIPTKYFLHWMTFWTTYYEWISGTTYFDGTRAINTRNY